MIDLDKYYTFILPVVVWFIVQGVKIIIFSIKHGWNIKNTLSHVGYGHMPSAHTGFIVSLVTAIGYYKGLDSGAFAVSVIMAIMIIDDSVRLRMHIGDYGLYLNRLVMHLNLEKKDFPKLKERMGHKVGEVIVGGILGIFLTLVLAELLKHHPIILF